MARFIDKRPNGRHKSAVNRQRFMRRFKQQIKEAVRQAISTRSIRKVDESGEKITIPAKDIKEPSFSYGQGGSHNIILPGNKEFIAGDQIKRPQTGAGGSGGTEASNNDDTGIDDFVFEISKDEFLEIFFEDLALPNLIKTQVAKTPTKKTVRAGLTSQGIPANIHVPKTLQNAIGRKLTLRAAKLEKLNLLETQQQQMESENAPLEEINLLKVQIEDIKKSLSKIPFIDPFDVKYHHRVIEEKPTTQAVIFCLMDVSGSMDEAKKDIAKRFFILLYLFLTRTYQNVELVFIRHHTSAKEVDEEEFFYSRETGGTVVSSALELMHEIMLKRYPASDWNIYAAQASDGDNWNNDSPHCKDVIVHHILPFVQYFAYVEIMPRHHQSLWESYLTVKEQFSNFAMQHIEDTKDIYPVFRSLFKKQDVSVKS